MNPVDHFQRLFSYDAWANREVLAGLRAVPQPPARSMKYIAHVLAAEHLWLNRLEQKEQSLPVWPEDTLGKWEQLAINLSHLWMDYLATTSAAELEKEVAYRNTRGEPWSSRRDDILTHVVMHSAYHRGQIAADMRAAGMTPALTDFIHSVRQGFIE